MMPRFSCRRASWNPTRYNRSLLPCGFPHETSSLPCVAVTNLCCRNKNGLPATRESNGLLFTSNRELYYVETDPVETDSAL